MIHPQISQMEFNAKTRNEIRRAKCAKDSKEINPAFAAIAVFARACF
jgi:hypothetical protein